MNEKKDPQQVMNELITKAWENETFKQELLSNPKAAIEKEFGVTIP